MAGRVNHRGWIVLESISSDDSSLCVDFFEDPEGGYGFEHLRSDPEDSGLWTVIGGFSAGRYDTPLAAANAALESVPWLRMEARATTQCERWLARIVAG